VGILNEANRWFEKSACKPVLDAAFSNGGSRIDYWQSPEPGEEDYRGAGWFPNTRAVPAKKVCNDCPVRVHCLSYALAGEEVEGIWGGMTPVERKRLADELEKLPRTERAQRIRQVGTSPVRLSPRSLRADSRRRRKNQNAA